jgi:hypothetical protein
LRDQHLLQVGARQYLLQHMGKIFDDDDAFRAGILELMFQLPCGVQRIGVDHHHAGAQHAEQCDRILQDVWHHQRDAFAGDQAGFLL